jgi:phosphohistidine swiveling domain-containing protein
MKWTLEFKDPLAQQTEYTGGKGSNLARLTAGGFDVPQGFVLTTEAYRNWIDTADGWKQAVRDLPKDNQKELPAAATALRHQLSEFPLPDTLSAEIRERVNQHPVNTAFAVRSSSNMEDMAEAAFAGQHDSFLNCIGADAVIESVLQCYLSLWHDRAIAYRQQNNCDQTEVQMAVVVQEMAACDSAGVAFSINPVSGDLNVAVINANFGLGESVVSGECEVDHIEVDKTSGEIITSRIADKSMFTEAAACGGTADRETAATSRHEAVLSAANIAAIIALLKQAETYFHFPQDIEWGFTGDRLVVLQSRPITTIPPRWTRDESAERFPNAFAPLAWDFMEAGFHRSMNHSFNLMGFPPFTGKWFGKHNHYIYGNQNAVELYAGQFPFTFTSLDDLPALIPQLREKYHWVQELPVHWTRDLDYYLIRLGEFLSEPLEEKSVSELWTFVKRLNEHGSQYFLPNIAISVTQGMLYKFLFFLLQALSGPEKAAGLMDQLLAFCETKTGAVNRELYDLAMIAREDPLLQERLRSQEGNQALWESGGLEFDHPAFYHPFALMMRNHGHRELEIDPYQPLWAEVPWVALDQIRLILDAPKDLPPAEPERELKIRTQEAEKELFREIPQDLHFFVHEIIRLTRVYTSLDDFEHYQTTRLTVPLRKGLRALGERLLERGVVKDPMDIFFARVSEVDAAIANDTSAEWQKLADVIIESKASWEAARNQAPTWTPEEKAVSSTAIESGAELSGIPGSPGVQEGEVFIVTCPQDFAEFPSGAILVARTTNPVWTPLFYTAAAVITESGGPLSHGAVTAREMRIPAVMSVHNCMSILRNGCSVRVNGSEGKVSLLDG